MSSYEDNIDGSFIEERQSSGGVMSALFGDRANTLKELPNQGLSESEVSTILSENLEN
jgi:hypothetical protein